MLDFVDEMMGKKNLLAFSGGGDSVALYFLLKNLGIGFDICIIDYAKRLQSKLEISYAKNLAFYDKRRCFVGVSPQFHSNFESHARAFRYDFFERLMSVYHYENLLLAHHLDDNFEWFLMQFCKGSNLHSALIPAFEQRVVDGRKYRLIRPLIGQPKRRLLEYLAYFGLFYFEDFSNHSTKYKRNYFRKHFTKALLAEFEKGIGFSLALLREQEIACSLEICDGGYFVFEAKRDRLYLIDWALKRLGYVLGRSQWQMLKDACQKDFSIVVGGKYAIEQSNGYCYVAPFVRHCLSKEQKESYRLAKIPPKIRCFLAKKGITAQRVCLDRHRN